jgi:excisionase family DNA binding protein
MQRNAQNRNEGGGLLRKLEVCRRLGICLRTLDYWLADDAIPHVRLGGAVRFVPADIDNLIASRRIKAAKTPAPRQGSKNPTTVNST